MSLSVVLAAANLNLPPTTLPNLSGGTGFDGGALLALAGKFGIVMLLLFLCLRILKVIMPGGRAQPGGRTAAMVLHTEVIGDKQRVCMLDLQSKIVVVGLSPAAVNPITTIDDAGQMEQLRERYRPQTAVVTRASLSLRSLLLSFAPALGARPQARPGPQDAPSGEAGWHNATPGNPGWKERLIWLPAISQTLAAKRPDNPARQSRTADRVEWQGRRTESPSFASTLAAATERAEPESDDDQAAVPMPREPWARSSPPARTHGDPALDQALERMRALRQQMSRA